MSTPDSSWRTPVAQREADAKKLDAGRLGSQAAKAESVRMAGSGNGLMGKNLANILMILTVIAVGVLLGFLVMWAT